MLLSTNIASFLMLTETKTINVPAIASTFICITIVAIAAFWVYNRYKNMPDGDQKLQDLFDSMKNIVIENIIESLEDLDFVNPESTLADIEAEFLDDIFDDIWNLFDKEIEKLADTDNLLYIALRKAITREKVEEYIAIIFAADEIQDKIISIYNVAIEKRNKEILEDEKHIAEQMAAYENDEVDAEPVEELDPMVDINAPVEDQKIIPPSEEESDTVSADDESVEILDGVEEDTLQEKPVPEATIADTESFDEE